MANNKLKNCPECKRIFVDMGTGICRDCYDKQQEKMDELCSYVRDNPNSKLKDICEALNVKERLVMRMIREGRFVTEGANIEYGCEACGAPINFGRFCEKCNDDLVKQVEQQREKQRAALEEAARRGIGMHSNRVLKK